MGIRDFIHNKIAKSELQETVDRLLEESLLHRGFFIRLFLSAAIATLGLLENNMAIVIGAMVIAPLLTPLLCLSLGGLSFKPKMIRYGLITVILGSILGIFTGAALVFILGKTVVPVEIVELYTFHSFDFLIIAFLAGMAGAFASLSQKTSEQLIGVAIAAALVPPLAFAGITLGLLEFELFRKTLILYLLNLLSTSLGAMVVYGIFLISNRVNTTKIEEHIVN